MESGELNKWRMKKLMFIPLIIVGIFAMGSVVMLLWNALIPEIFGLMEITFWQAIGLLALSKILFGGNGFGRGRRHKRSFRMRDKFRNMSEEEKEEFKEKWRHRCQ